jgi:hypothetical protein
MTTYYRTTDGALIELTPEQIGQLAPNKRDTLKAYSVDAEPTLSDTQFVAPGPVVVDGSSARRTWVVVDKSPDQIAGEAFQVQRAVELDQIRAAYAALKAGTGTAAERLTRCERVLARLLKDMFGGETK